MGGGGILEAIDAGLRGDWGAALKVPTQQLGHMRWQYNDYVTVLSRREDPQHIQSFHASFGPRTDPAKLFLNGLSQCIRQQDLPDMFPIELRVRPFWTSVGLLTGGAEFNDGLAYFGGAVGSQGGSYQWSPDKGFLE